MLGTPAREACTLLRDTLPRTFREACAGAAASFKAPSTVRRRRVQVHAQCAASCEVVSACLNLEVTLCEVVVDFGRHLASMGMLS